MKTLLMTAPALLLAVSVSVAGAADAPSDSLRTRPTIGVAFGGGGARGAAHVGVIRVLEELQIPVDYVAGTSMGSIVGALYALGLDAAEIETELEAVDWGDLFVDRMPRRNRPMRRKEDDRASFFPLEWGWKRGGLQTPRGVIAGQKFPFAFGTPGLHSAGHAGFDDLPIPYRAVATDLETGERVVLDRGNLLRAVRASMSIPGIFPPVEHEGRLLVDGYLASNVPVDAVRAMGADIVIAIEVGRRQEDMTSEDLETMGGIREAAARIRSQLALEEELGRADVVIRPDLEAWTGQEYDRLPEIMVPGEEAARRSRGALAPLAVDEDAYRAWRARVRATPVPSEVVDLVVLDNRSRVDDRAITEWLDVATDEPLDRDLLRRDLEEVYELGIFETVDFDMHREDVYNVLTIRPHEKPYAPYLVHLGAAYVSSYHGASRFQLQARLNWREVNRLGAEWRTDLAVGRTLGVHTEFYQPLDWGRRWYLAPAAGWVSRTDGLFLTEPNTTVVMYEYKRLAGTLDLGRSVGRWLDLRVGAEVARLGYDFTVGLVGLPPDRGEIAGPRAVLTIDTLDSHVRPYHGLFVQADYERPSGWLGTDLEYERLWGHALWAVGGERNTILLDAQAGTDLGTTMPFTEDFYLGGLRTLSGYNTSYLRGDAFGLASVGWLHRLGGSDLPFASRVHLGLWAEAGNTWLQSQDFTMDDLLYCGAVTLLIDTVAGPLHLGYGRSDRGRDAFHLEYGIHLASPRN
jgi:NTE family protein